MVVTKKIVKKRKPSKPSKTIKPNGNKSNLQKGGSLYKTAKDLLSWRKHDPGKNFIDRMCDDMHTWVKLEDSIDLYEFYEYYGIPSTTFEELANKYTDLKDTVATIKEYIGNKRQRFMLQKKYGYDGTQVGKAIHFYHKNYKEIRDEELSIRRKDDEKAPTHITVEMQDFSKKK